MVHVDPSNPSLLEKMGDKLTIDADLDKENMTNQTKALNISNISESPEVFITDDNIAHTQERQNVEEDRLMVELMDQDQVKANTTAAPSIMEDQF